MRLFELVNLFMRFGNLFERSGLRQVALAAQRMAASKTMIANLRIERRYWFVPPTGLDFYAGVGIIGLMFVKHRLSAGKFAEPTAKFATKNADERRPSLIHVAIPYEFPNF